MQQIQNDAADLEQRIEAEGCTLRHIAELVELYQRMLDVYDELLENPPAILPVDEAEIEMSIAAMNGDCQ